MDAYLAAAAILAAATILGQAIWTLTIDRRWSWAAPGVGLATLIAICSAAIKLPGDATSAAVVLAIAVAMAGAVLLFVRPTGRPAPVLLLVVPLGLAAASVPFIATGRVALLGVGLSNDTAQHLVLGEVLRSDALRAVFGTTSYPMGPHSVMTTLAQGLGMDLDRPMLGFLLAVQVLTAVVAMGALAGITRWARLPAALAVAFTYLLVAYFGQGAFKETVLALLLLTFAQTLQQLAERGRPFRARSGVALGLITAGTVLTYSYVGLAWLAASLGILGALWIADALARRRPVGPALRSIVPMALAAAVAAVLGVATDLGRIASFFHSIGFSPVEAGDQGRGIAATNLGNLTGPLPAAETLGIWPSTDFRVAPPPDTFMFGALKLTVLAAVVYGVVVLLRRREGALPATLGGAAVIYLGARGHESPYVVAKALAVMAPLAMLIALRGLLLPRALVAGAGGTRAAGVKFAIAAVVIVGAAQSSLMLLRATPVASTAQRDQLAELRHVIGHQPTLFLPIDDYAAWNLRGAPLGYFSESGFGATIPLKGNPKKPWSVGQPADFDSVSPEDLDHFRYVVTTRGANASTAPPNIHPVRKTALYTLWERRGPTDPRRTTIEQPGSSTATLRCRRTKQHGGATVWSRTPIAIPSPPPLASGTNATVTVNLPRGVWDLSTQYQSALPLRVLVDSRPARDLPANTTRQGPFWPLARVRSSGKPISLYLTARRQSRLTSAASNVILSTIVATPAARASTIPLDEACGRQVDHYIPG